MYHYIFFNGRRHAQRGVSCPWESQCILGSEAVLWGCAERCLGTEIGVRAAFWNFLHEKLQTLRAALALPPCRPCPRRSDQGPSPRWGTSPRFAWYICWWPCHPPSGRTEDIVFMLLVPMARRSNVSPKHRFKAFETWDWKLLIIVTANIYWVRRSVRHRTMCFALRFFSNFFEM